METILDDLKNLSASDLQSFIQRAETLMTNKCSPTKSPLPDNHPSVESLCDYYNECGIDTNIVDEAMSEIKALESGLKKQGSFRPTLLVIGVRYYFSYHTELNLVPVPFSKSPKVHALVLAYNQKFGTSYNSVLVSHYRECRVFLPWHKDDEHMLDPEHPIGSLSDGAWRRFQVAVTKGQHAKVIHEYLLAARSFLVMKPGFQTHFYHQLAKGRSSKFKNEGGTRDNLTMRKVLDKFIDNTPEQSPSTVLSDPSVESPVAEPKEESSSDITTDEPIKTKDVVRKVHFASEDIREKVHFASEDIREKESAATTGYDHEAEAKAANDRRAKSSKKKVVIEMSTKLKDNECDAIVFGSSLVKDLEPDLLSKYGKSFTVLSRSSAHISDIAVDIKTVRDKAIVDVNSVKNVFLVCGGNDVENLPGDESLDNIFDDFKHLFALAKETFSNARINVLSLMPRRVNKYGQEHVYLMHDVNQFLSDNAKTFGVRFVNVYSCFIRRNGRLNLKCFNNSKIHFSKTGNSVLGKFIIAVTYRPRQLL